MAPRPYWRGHLRLSLVTCAVALYPTATASERVAFHWINRETGNRLKQLMVDGETGKEVAREQRVRGYEVAPHEYLPIEDEDLEAVEIESSHTLDIRHFVPVGEVDPVFAEGSYYLAPSDKVSEEAFAVIREAMRARQVAGLAQIVLSNRERLMLLEPRGKGLLGTRMRYAYEVREDAAYFEDIKDIAPSKDMIGLAEHIITTKLGAFDAAAFEDRYETALVEMIRAKQAGRPLPERAPDRPSNVVNLMDALKRSLAADKAALDAASEEAEGPQPRSKRGKTANRASAKAVKPADEKPPRTTKRKAG